MSEPTPPAPGAVSGSLEEQLAVKTAKIAELRARGVDPFPSRCQRTHTAAEALKAGEPLTGQEHGPETFAVAGRLLQIRDMGKSIFAHIQDSSGKLQIYFKKDAMPEADFHLVKKDLHAGDFISAVGPLFRTRTQEITLAATGAAILAKALRPMPEKWHGLKDVETRYRQRHLDLIASPESRDAFIKRSKIVASIRKTFDSLGFIEVETPVLLPHAGGASARPFKTHHNALDQEMFLRIATELHLKRLIVGGLDKVYELGRIFRNEGIDTRHNPEFTMLEAYEAYSDYEGMARLFERVVAEAADAIGVSEAEFQGVKLSLKPPFQRVYLPELWKKHCGAPMAEILEGKSFNRTQLPALPARPGVPAGDKTPSAKIFERSSTPKSWNCWTP